VESQGLSDRPAIYKLYKHYGMEPTDVSLGKVQPSVIHDARGQIREVRDGQGQQHKFEYDTNGQLTKVSSKDSFVYERQSDGSWTRSTDFGMGPVEKTPGHFELEPNGTMRWQERGGDRTVNYPDGRITTFEGTSKKVDNSLHGETLTKYEYGPDGRLSSMTIDNGADRQVWRTTDGTTWIVHDPKKPDAQQIRKGSIEISSEGSPRWKGNGQEAKPIGVD